MTKRACDFAQLAGPIYSDRSMRCRRERHKGCAAAHNYQEQDEVFHDVLPFAVTGGSTTGLSGTDAWQSGSQ